MRKNNEMIKEALSDYAYRQYHKPNNVLTAEQWLVLLNGYAHELNSEECAKQCGLSGTQVTMYYCCFAVAVSTYAIQKSRTKYIPHHLKKNETVA